MWFDWLIMIICCKNKKTSWISEEFPDYFLILERLEGLEGLEDEKAPGVAFATSGAILWVTPSGGVVFLNYQANMG
jgi:hypothetical protein